MQISERAIMRSQASGPPGPLSMAFAPFARFADTEPIAKMIAVVVAALQLAWSDFFILALGALFIAGAWDWAWGRSIAKARGTFDARISTWGWQSKASGIGLGIFIRIAEGRAEATNIFVTHGWVATAVVMTLVFHEIRSIDKKRQSLGGPPLPLLGAILEFGERALANMVPHLKEPEYGRRAGDTPVERADLERRQEDRRGPDPFLKKSKGKILGRDN